jgi:large subunit ribosomal protein L6
MSRVANKPIELKGVQVTLVGQQLSIKGSKGALSMELHPNVEMVHVDAELRVKARDESKQSIAHAGTARALANNIVVGVSEGFQKKLLLVGVGYRAQAQGNKLNLSLGFSHPVVYDLPEVVTAETPTQTEIILKSINKQVLGQVAAEIRAYRPPEPYKGKGIRYADEKVVIKETKKK